MRILRWKSKAKKQPLISVLQNSLLGKMGKLPRKYPDWFPSSRTVFLKHLWWSALVILFFVVMLYKKYIVKLMGKKMEDSIKKLVNITGLNIYFLSLDRLPGRINATTSDKVNFRPDIWKNFIFEKEIRTSKVCVPLKTIWNYYTFINIKLGYAQVHQYLIVPQ